jgi:predicted glycosyltransferase
MRGNDTGVYPAGGQADRKSRVPARQAANPPMRERGVTVRQMRVWIDLTNSPHVLVMRPVIERLRADGHEVEVTARDFAQTLALCERFGIAHTAIGHHRGERLGAKATGLASRSAALVRWARSSNADPPASPACSASSLPSASSPASASSHASAASPASASSPANPAAHLHPRRRRRRFDIALGHGSNDVSVAAALLRIPSATMFDYEWASVQHNVNCRLARAVVVPDAIPPARLERYGARGKIRAYEGLKEEYYLADFEPDPRVLDELGLDVTRPIVVVRTPPEVSLYHRFENDLFARVLQRLREAAAADGLQPVVLPRVDAQRRELAGVPGFVVPERAIDAQSLIAHADLVISAGGTMNREAVALGTPVYTTFEGRLGAVDERLIGEGRLRKLEDPGELDLERRLAGADTPRVRRDPQVLVDLLLSPLGD